MDDGQPPIKISGGVGVVGLMTSATSLGEGSSSTVINRSGSMVRNVIPSVIVVCEDVLAETILGMVSREVDGSFKVITAGAWENMPTLLYGIYFYRNQVIAAGDKRHLEVVCVMDGDIRDKDFKKGLAKVHNGVHVTQDVKDALTRIEENLVGFKLNDIRPFRGLPEYHHQLWLDEISDDVIDGYHEAELSKLRISPVGEDVRYIPGSEVQVGLLLLEIAEVKRIVSCSRAIPFYTLKDKEQKIDCHSYYKVLKQKLLNGDSLLKHQVHNLEYHVLSIIRKYNPERWQAYIEPVRIAMHGAFRLHVKMFSPDRFNFAELGES